MQAASACIGGTMLLLPFRRISVQALGARCSSLGASEAAAATSIMAVSVMAVG